METETKFTERTVTIDSSEAISLADFLEHHLVEIIRSDIDIENISYVANLIHVWERCSDQIAKNAIARRLNDVFGFND